MRSLVATPEGQDGARGRSQRWLRIGGHALCSWPCRRAELGHFSDDARRVYEPILEETHMTAMSIRLPASLSRNARAYAEQEGVAVNHLIAKALAEKLAALGAQDFLALRAARGRRTAFEGTLAQVAGDGPVAGGDLRPL